MANNIIGAPIAHATAYKLLKKSGSDYQELATAEAKLTNLGFTNDGYYDYDGNWYISAETGIKSTDFIPIYALANDTDGYCLRYLEAMETAHPKVAFFSSNFTFMGSAGVDILQDGNTSATAFAVERITIARDEVAPGAAYAVFISGTADDYAGANDSVTINGIYFNLDEITSLGTGTHTLVVQAIGEGRTDVNEDGIIYIDSDYSNAVTFTKS